MLRAAYFGQELLSTFSTAIGEVALVPATGGIFQVHLTYKSEANEAAAPQEFLIWDRKAEGGFPETKVLKQRVRNHIEPGRDLGHSDKPSTIKDHKVATPEKVATKEATRDSATSSAVVEKGATAQPSTAECEDCK